MRALLLAIAFASSAFAQDTRGVVPLDAAERAHVLAEMRGFLSLIQESTGALARDDFDALAALRPTGARRAPFARAVVAASPDLQRLPRCLPSLEARTPQTS